MSSSRNSVSENQASASENESDRHATVGKHRGTSSQNKHFQSNQSSDDSHSPSNQKYTIFLLLINYEKCIYILSCWICGILFSIVMYVICKKNSKIYYYYY